MKNLLLLILFTVVSKTGYCDSDKEITYRIGGFNSEITIQLSPKTNRFVQKTSVFDCVSTTSNVYIFGDYTHHKNEIQLLPEIVTLSQTDDTTQSKESFIPYDQNGQYAIKTHYYQVDISGDAYLLSDEFHGDFHYEKTATNDFQELVSDFNEENSIWTFYFSSMNSFISNYTIDDLPQKWRNLLKSLSNKVYKVQLGVFQNPQSFDTSSVEELGNISYLKTENGLTIILLGEFETYESAKTLVNTIKEKGQEAMVVAVENGQKVPLK